LGVGSYTFLAEQLIGFNELGHMPIKGDIKHWRQMGKVQCWKAQGLSSEIHPSKVGMIKKQQQDDDKVSTSSSANTHSYHRVINFKDDSCFLWNNPTANGPEVYIMLQYTVWAEILAR